MAYRECIYRTTHKFCNDPNIDFQVLPVCKLKTDRDGTFSDSSIINQDICRFCSLRKGFQ